MNHYLRAGHLLEGFTRSVERFANRPALNVDQQELSYEQLDCWANLVASAVLANDPSESRFTGILAHRSVLAYASVLGVLRSGRCYVPLNPKFPSERTARMIRAAALKTLVVGEEARTALESLLSLDDMELVVICETRSMAAEFRQRFPTYQFRDLESQMDHRPSPVPSSTDLQIPAYLLFTSGSTGIPKGVPVSHGNVLSYLAYTVDRYDVTPQDRFSQTFDMTFDLSVHDMFVCWGAGACLCCVPERSTMAPAKFISDKAITMWFSVPSVVTIMQRMRLLRADSFPTIRFSLFCGEPLLASSADAWQQAASNSIVENLYGPTEATIATTNYRWNPEVDKCAEFPNGVVPIGTPFPGQQCIIVDKELAPVVRGETGELCLSGSQVTAGYFNNEEKTKAHFVQLKNWHADICYRTGDLVNQGEDGCLFYRGRIDTQLQVRGHRVELQEIEHVLRAAGDESAVAIGWPINSGNVSTIYAVFCQSPCLDTKQIMTYCRRHLPDYMVPSKILTLPKIPLNANGKVDRRAIGEQLQEIIDD